MVSYRPLLLSSIGKCLTKVLFEIPKWMTWIASISLWSIMYAIIISFRKVHTSVLDYSRKKEEVGGYGISNIFEEIASEFSGELIKSNVEFPGGWSRKNHMEYPSVLVLRLKISVGCNTVCRVSTGEALLCLEFPGVKQKPKNS